MSYTKHTELRLTWCNYDSSGTFVGSCLSYDNLPLCVPLRAVAISIYENNNILVDTNTGNLKLNKRPH